MSQEMYLEDFRAGNRKPKTIFKAGCKGENFMTPNIESYGPLNQWGAFEYATGGGFDPTTTLHGITVVVIEDGEPRHNHQLSEAFFSEAEAREYVEKLREYNSIPQPEEVK